MELTYSLSVFNVVIHTSTVTMEKKLMIHIESVTEA